MNDSLDAPAEAGYISIAERLKQSDERSFNNLMRGSGIVAIIIDSLIFLVVFAWVDAFSQLYKDHAGMREPKALTTRAKFIFALLLTLATVGITYGLYYIWKQN